MRACPARVALVVEDEWIVRNNIVNELRESGWTVVETATGEEALALLADREVDVVLTDIQLAGAMTGWDVARAARGARPNLPVIYASANASDPLRRVEGSLFFGKPYDPEQIVEACQSGTSLRAIRWFVGNRMLCVLADPNARRTRGRPRTKRSPPII